MIAAIAWRNVWRNKKRSAVILTAIILGLWAGLFANGLMYGMIQQIIQNAIGDRLGHVQIHAPGYRDHPEVTNVIPNSAEALTRTRQEASVKAASGRIILNGMASSASNSLGAQLFGVDPSTDTSVVDLEERLVEGTWLNDSKRNPIVIGQAMAEKLGLRVGNKVIFQAQALNGDIAGGAFRIVGLYNTVNSVFDKTAMFARQSDVDRVFSMDGNVHQIIILADNFETIDATATSLKQAFPDLDVAGWKEISPELGMYSDMSAYYLMIFIVIILVALAFSITNTMLMAVVERIREFGVIKALGMGHGKIFTMILLETIMLTLLGCLGGMVTGWATVAIVNKTGLNLAAVSDGLEAFGMSTVIRPELPFNTYPQLIVLTFLTAIIAAIYPAIKAIRLNPVEAIRTYG